MSDNPHEPGTKDIETQRIAAAILARCGMGMIPLGFPVQDEGTLSSERTYTPLGAQDDSEGRATFEQVCSLLRRNSRR